METEKTYFRVSYDGYIEGEYETQAEAIQEFLDVIANDGGVTGTWEDNLTIEKFNAETGEWE